jgi:hypothetical protein
VQLKPDAVYVETEAVTHGELHACDAVSGIVASAAATPRIALFIVPSF